MDVENKAADENKVQEQIEATQRLRASIESLTQALKLLPQKSDKAE